MVLHFIRTYPLPKYIIRTYLGALYKWNYQMKWYFHIIYIIPSLPWSLLNYYWLKTRARIIYFWDLINHPHRLYSLIIHEVSRQKHHNWFSWFSTSRRRLSTIDHLTFVPLNFLIFTTRWMHQHHRLHLNQHVYVD